MSSKQAHGIVHGKRIELDEDLGLSEGQVVEVRVTIVPRTGDWGQGILRSAGGWAQYPELDDVMDQIQQDRKVDRGTQTHG